MNKQVNANRYDIAASPDIVTFTEEQTNTLKVPHLGQVIMEIQYHYRTLQGRIVTEYYESAELAKERFRELVPECGQVSLTAKRLDKQYEPRTFALVSDTTTTTNYYKAFYEEEWYGMFEDGDDEVFKFEVRDSSGENVLKGQVTNPADIILSYDHTDAVRVFRADPDGTHWEVTGGIEGLTDIIDEGDSSVTLESEDN